MAALKRGSERSGWSGRSFPPVPHPPYRALCEATWPAASPCKQGRWARSALAPGSALLWVSEEPPRPQHARSTDQNLANLVRPLVQDRDPVHFPELVSNVDQA